MIKSKSDKFKKKENRRKSKQMMHIEIFADNRTKKELLK